ncbi:MAG: 50S ribosomal protein L31 [Patescibacteria group bacterium]
MKTDIHPEFHIDAKATCACGASFVVGSTMKDIHMEICSHCHPFYTGKEKILDTAGRVEKFRQRKAAATPKTKGKKSKA